MKYPKMTNGTSGIKFFNLPNNKIEPIPNFQIKFSFQNIILILLISFSRTSRSSRASFTSPCVQLKLSFHTQIISPDSYLSPPFSFYRHPFRMKLRICP